MSTSALTKEQIDSLIALVPFATEEELAEIEELLAAAGHLEGASTPPHPRQADFLNLRTKEILYGGAAGSGKSWALLTWLAQGVQLPGYSAVLFRRTQQDLKKSGDSILSKSFEIFKPLGGTFNGQDLKWTFQTGGKPATVELGGLEHPNTQYEKYIGSQYHRVAWDELNTFLEDQYVFFFSRMRANVGFPLQTGMAASCNPDQSWVKKRFVSRDAINTMRGWHYTEPTPKGLIFWNEGRAFVPARLADNPTVDFLPYVENMQHLPPVLRERWLNGDWEIAEDGQIKQHWLRRFKMRGEIIELEGGPACHQAECRRFMTIDSAGTSADKAKEARGKPRARSAIQVWDQFPTHAFGQTLILRHATAKYLEFIDLVGEIVRIYDEWKPSSVRIEDENFGKSVVSLIRRETSRVPIEPISTGGKDKVDRATKLLNMLEKGRVFLPSKDWMVDQWISEIESEWLSWKGHPDEVCDQVDAAAYAAIIATQDGSSCAALDFDVTAGIGL